jgi:GTP cyclohydrolase I
MSKISLTLGMDLTDDSIKAHPTVLLRCLLKKFLGLNPERKPKASTFDNNYKYGEIKKKTLSSIRLASIIYYQL